MKTLTARMKEVTSAAIQIDDVFAKEDWLTASSLIERGKRELLANIRTKMHERIATLSLDDIDFKII